MNKYEPAISSPFVSTRQEGSNLIINTESWEGRKVSCFSKLWDEICEIFQKIFDSCLACFNRSEEQSATLPNNWKVRREQGQLNRSETTAEQSIIMAETNEQNLDAEFNKDKLPNKIENPSFEFEGVSTDDSSSLDEKSLNSSRNQPPKFPTSIPQGCSLATITRISEDILNSNIDADDHINLNLKENQGDASNLDESKLLLRSSDRNLITTTNNKNVDSLKVLSKHVLRGALLKQNPLITEFKCDGCTLTVINHTSKEIKIKNDESEFYDRGLFVNNELYTDFTKDDCQIIAYSLEDIPEIICLEQKDVESSEISQRLILSALDSHTTIEKFDTIVLHLPEISEKIYQPKIFTEIFLGFKDGNSFFCKNNIIKDIILPIFQQYNRALEEQFTPDVLNSQLGNVLKLIPTRVRRDGPASWNSGLYKRVSAKFFKRS
ncbi:MAG: hypothetical protein H0T62_05360 [Parachlamydiaceae bacterium]|nr:hypothetical protein [Parachlamydiaceae bacterium]